MLEGRIKKAQARPVLTDARLGALKPGLKLQGCEPKVYTLEELRSRKFRIVSWDGMLALSF